MKEQSSALEHKLILESSRLLRHKLRSITRKAGMRCYHETNEKKASSASHCNLPDASLFLLYTIPIFLPYDLRQSLLALVVSRLWSAVCLPTLSRALASWIAWCARICLVNRNELFLRLVVHLISV